MLVKNKTFSPYSVPTTDGEAVIPAMSEVNVDNLDPTFVREHNQEFFSLSEKPAEVKNSTKVDVKTTAKPATKK